MLLTRDMVDAFGDRLELDRIRQALLAARPELAGALVLDEMRPLLRIQGATGTALLVARTGEGSSAGCIVGIPGRSAPVLHDTCSSAEVITLVLNALPSPPADPARAGAGRRWWVCRRNRLSLAEHAGGLRAAPRRLSRDSLTSTDDAV